MLRSSLRCSLPVLFLFVGYKAFVANQRVILSTFSGKSTVLQGIGEESSIHKVSFLMTRGGPILAILHGLEVILFRGTRKLATVDFGDPPQEAGFDKLVCIVPSYQEGLYLVTSMRGSVFRLVQHEREGVWEHGGLLNTVPLMDTSSHSFFLTCSTRVGRDTLLFGTDEGEVMTSTGVFARQLPETRFWISIHFERTSSLCLSSFRKTQQWFGNSHRVHPFRIVLHRKNGCFLSIGPYFFVVPSFRRECPSFASMPHFSP